MGLEGRGQEAKGFAMGRRVLSKTGKAWEGRDGDTKVKKKKGAESVRKIESGVEEGNLKILGIVGKEFLFPQKKKRRTVRLIPFYFVDCF